MDRNPKYRKWYWGAQVVFWLMLSLLMYLVFLWVFDHHAGRALAIMSVRILGLLALIYLHKWYFLSHYFYRGKYYSYALCTVLLILFVSIWIQIFSFVLPEHLNWVMIPGYKPTITKQFVAVLVFLPVATSPLILIENWFGKKELEGELEAYQLQAELKFLKTQMSPHFLFNALNNLYALSFTESEKTPEMILKLSDMMSYMIYDCASDKVPLSSEISYLENYIALHQLRKDGEINMNFEVIGDPGSLRITPMLLIPFVENALKHGDLDKINHGWMRSKLVVGDKVVIFEISNTFNGNANKLTKGGVGLGNIKERLRLLFPNRHELNIESDHKIFNVSLNIEFDSKLN